jgi:predicted ATPase
MPSPTAVSIHIFSRSVAIPEQQNGVAKFDFSYLCEADLGSADYISIASKYHTIILDKVPVLMLNKKNEARRLISLIDALYESKCKLLIRAEATPDALFFPETGGMPSSDSIASEAFSETFYDVTNPNRPNISSYATTVSDEKRDAVQQALPRQDFGRLNAFTGQDEQFAFGRAASRLYEMTSREWWEKAHHLPNEPEERMWERPLTDREMQSAQYGKRPVTVKHGSPFRVHPQPSPLFSMEHFWKIVQRGGKRAPSNPKDWEK